MSARVYPFVRSFTLPIDTPIPEIMLSVQLRGWYSFEMKPNLDAGTVTIVRVSEAKATRAHEEFYNATQGDTK
ncbi:MAG: hypothetical protein QNI96_05115 [Woeseiaceae bacterium]|nr:hypothetical protein [Woeseiaceae bacterium]